MIAAQALTKSFKATRGRVVRGIEHVSFNAADGQITGLLGPNGAGKSTTLRILSTLMHADSGSATIDGHDVNRDALEVRRSIGFLPHDSGIYPRLTARENIRYYADICGVPAQKSRDRTDELVNLLDMESFADRRARGFSQGQKTKVGLARALVHNPGTIMLDEPTNGLDVMATRGLRTIIRRLADAGHCVLFSSHIMQEVEALCDHIAIISDGRVAMEDSLDGLRERTGQRSLEDAFVVAIGETPEPV
ncbi:MAG: ATP-binding cassette domain-containing protein [Gammaproteobacteria bacterium]|nr:ATP-binding cassette domain-containing protein [Gammaproteobacteria bacterium]